MTPQELCGPTTGQIAMRAVEDLLTYCPNFSRLCRHLARPSGLVVRCQSPLITVWISPVFHRDGPIRCRGEMYLTTPTTLISPAELKALRDEWSTEGARVAFVPTMGALHAGHLSLVKAARAEADRVIVSIFVNPLQFGPTEDFSRYPRSLKADLDLLTPAGVEAVYVPNAATIYPEGYQTVVHNKEMADGLCGAARVGHFDGVLTVVLKLFNLVRPDVAIFGKKDYQQWRLIERMALDLNLSVRVVGAEILRDPDGLAMSSRNRYLADTERPVATRLYQGLSAAREAHAAGKRTSTDLLEAFDKVVGGVAGVELEYVEVRRQHDLTSFTDKIDAPAVMLVAARVGTTRLIDNVEMA